MSLSSTTNLHALLLLSDSALPLGSFAFSSGLESFLAHSKVSNAGSKAQHTQTKPIQAFEAFLEHSLSNLASSALPYVLAAYRAPDTLEDLDNDFDAATPCTVARRASVAQGRALLTVWERALMPSMSDVEASEKACQAVQDVTFFATAVKTSKPVVYGLQLNAHFPPLFGAVCRALSLSVDDTAYLFFLNHAKAVLSAAVRASVMGPYQSQAVLASSRLQSYIRACIAREKGRQIADAAVTVPTMDLWMGRHELLYSRIFNS